MAPQVTTGDAGGSYDAPKVADLNGRTWRGQEGAMWAALYHCFDIGPAVPRTHAWSYAEGRDVTACTRGVTVAERLGTGCHCGTDLQKERDVCLVRITHSWYPL